MPSSAATADQSVIDRRAKSVAQLFLDRVAASPDAEAFRFPRPGGDAATAAGWQGVDWRTVGERVRAQAAGLIALGVQPEQRVALAASTRYEWVLADLAVMCAGAATTTVYPSSTDTDVAYIVADSQSRVVFAEDDAQIAKLRQHRDELPDVAQVVTFDGTPDGDWVISLTELEHLGTQRLDYSPDVVEERVAAIEAEDLATLIYTSGTTGRPKGVRLAHSCWTYLAAAVDSVELLGPDDLQYVWLPLSHVFGKMLLSLPLQIGFPTVIDGRVDKIVENLAVVRPTFMGAAPRIFEKAHSRVVAVAHGEGGVKAKIFDWAIGVGRKYSEVGQQHGAVASRPLTLQHRVADRLVFAKIRERFGGRLRFFISGSAALDRDVAQWFDGVGIVILEGYGLSETSAATAVNRPDSYRFGTVGRPIPGTELRIAEDGEVLVRSAGVMQGYHQLPEATAEALDSQGWLHTGDIGELSADGYLKITDRKKDLFKTSNGKYVAPSALDAQFKGICPYVGELIVVGDDRSYCTALITLDAEAIQGWADQHGMRGRSYAEIATSSEVREVIQGYLDRLNAKVNRWESIRKFTILDHELTVEDGEITPSMKVRRKLVLEKYADELAALYA